MYLVRPINLINVTYYLTQKINTVKIISLYHVMEKKI